MKINLPTKIEHILEHSFSRSPSSAEVPRCRRELQRQLHCFSFKFYLAGLTPNAKGNCSKPLFRPATYDLLQGVKRILFNSDDEKNADRYCRIHSWPKQACSSMIEYAFSLHVSKLWVESQQPESLST